MNWLYYLLEANLYLCVLYALYRLVLQHETFYKLNRWYLFAMPFIAFIIPLVSVKQDLVPQSPAFFIPNEAFVITGAPIMENGISPEPGFSFDQFLPVVYAVGVLFFTLRMLAGLLQVLRMYYRLPKYRTRQVTYIYLKSGSAAFSFFRWLFIPKQMVRQETVIAHEAVHICQGHSVDIVLAELVSICCWFNPFVHLFTKDIKLNHEYLADDLASRKNGSYDYALLLIGNAYQGNGNHLVNPIFNYSQLKKRIHMLEKQKSAGKARLKYLLTVPVLAGLWVISAFVVAKDYALIELSLPSKVSSMESKTGPDNISEALFRQREQNPQPSSGKAGELLLETNNVLADTIHKDLNDKVLEKYDVYVRGKYADTLYVKKGKYRITEDLEGVYIEAENNYIVDSLAEKGESRRLLVLAEDGKPLKSYDLQSANNKISFVSKGQSKVYFNNKNGQAVHAQDENKEKVKLQRKTKLPTEAEQESAAALQTGAGILETDKVTDYASIHIDATTDTVRLTKVAAGNPRKNQFEGIYVIGETIYTEEELKHLIGAEGEMEVVFPNRPVIGVYGKRDKNAISKWGEKAGNGVVYVMKSS